MEKIKATMVLEILGRPAEHIKNALSELVGRLGAEKGVKVMEKTIHEPVEVKESKDLYTTFAEVSVELDSLANYFGVLFAYMPAHIEIFSPTNFTLSNAEFNELGNKIIGRLHEYDAITKKFVYERNFLLSKLKEVAPELFRQITQAKPQNAEVAAPVENPENNKKEKKSKRKSQKSAKK
jgi:hypothetical protein